MGLFLNVAGPRCRPTTLWNCSLIRLGGILLLMLVSKICCMDVNDLVQIKIWPPYTPRLFLFMLHMDGVRRNG